MKLFLIFYVFFMSVFSCYSEEMKNTDVLNHQEFDFDSLPKKTLVGNLLEHVKTTEPSTYNQLDMIKMQFVVHPFREEFVYLNNALCHTAYYSRSIIYTVVEGEQFGLQFITSYNGVILYVNYDYEIKETRSGITLHHFYSDSEVITGQNQVMMFY